MTELIRRAHARAVRTGATVYGFITYARLVLVDTAPDTGACGMTYITAEPNGAIARYTYNPTVQHDDGSFGAWRITATARVDSSGTILAAVSEADR